MNSLKPLLLRTSHALICHFPLPIFCLLLIPSLAAAAQTLTVQSSDSLNALGQAWAKAYAGKNPDFRIELKPGGTAAAFQALAKSEVQLALVPRSMRYPEVQACEQALGRRLVEFKVAVNGLAIYVHPGNPVKELTYDELFALYSGKYRNWKDVGGNEAPVSAFGTDKGSGLGELFAEEVMNGKLYTVQTLSETDLLTAVAKNQHAIGFGSLTQNPGVRAMPIKRAFSSTPVAPSAEDISARIYPISRFVFCYVGTTNSDAKLFLDWVRGDEGQQIAAKAGCYPLAAKWRTNP
jgi:phosphate transport system substrate-binding protein